MNKLKKRKINLSPFLPLILVIILLLSVNPTLAQDKDEIIFTTYYPAPYGVYNQMVTETLGVGDNSGDNNIDSADAPDPATNSGDVWIAGRVGIGTNNPSLTAKLHAEGGSISGIYGTTSDQMGVVGVASSLGGTGVYGYSPDGNGVWGASTNGNGVWGGTSNGVGVTGYSNGNVGVYGTSNSNYGVTGYSNSNYGVYGYSNGNYGVYGRTDAANRIGVYGYNPNGTGVSGESESTGWAGVTGFSDGTIGGVYGVSNTNNGVRGDSNSSIASGVYGQNNGGGWGTAGRTWSWERAGVWGDNPGGNGVLGTSGHPGASGVIGTSPGFGVAGSGGSNDFYAFGPGTDYGSASSIRWKRNIKPIDNALDKVLKLRGVYFDWDKEHGGRHDIGMIAEEVGRVLPEIVDYEVDGKYTRGMDYSRLTTVLVEAIKEQQKQIDVLKAEISSLKKSLLGG